MVLGRNAEAVAIREGVLAGYRLALPPDHPLTLAATHNLAAGYMNTRRPDDARMLFERTLETRKRVLGPDHPDTLRTATALAASLVYKGRLAEALALREGALEAQKRVLGPDHPDAIQTLSGLATNYYAMGRRADSLAAHEQIAAAQRRVLPPDHPEALQTLALLALGYHLEGRGADAARFTDEFVARSAGKPAYRPTAARLLGQRLRHFRAAADPAGCRATCEMYETLALTDAAHLYDAARFRAAAQAGGDPASAALDADRAMAWLTKAVAAGYRDAARMDADADLAVLRGRPDFQRLLASITPEAAPAPRVAGPAAK